MCASVGLLFLLLFWGGVPFEQPHFEASVQRNTQREVSRSFSWWTFWSCVNTPRLCSAYLASGCHLSFSLHVPVFFLLLWISETLSGFYLIYILFYSSSLLHQATQRRFLSHHLLPKPRFLSLGMPVRTHGSCFIYGLYSWVVLQMSPLKVLYPCSMLRFLNTPQHFHFLSVTLFMFLLFLCPSESMSSSDQANTLRMLSWNLWIPFYYWFLGLSILACDPSILSSRKTKVP